MFPRSSAAPSLQSTSRKKPRKRHISEAHNTIRIGDYHGSSLVYNPAQKNGHPLDWGGADAACGARDCSVVPLEVLLNGWPDWLKRYWVECGQHYETPKPAIRARKYTCPLRDLKAVFAKVPLRRDA